MKAVLKSMFLSFILVAASACGRVEQREDEKTTDSSVVDEAGFIIDAEGVGAFRLGEDIPTKLKDARYSLSKKMVLVEGEGEQYEEPWYVLSMGGNEILRILPGYDPETDDFSNVVGEIRIESALCSTKEGANVGDTLEQLAALYRKLTLWYSYVSDMFVAETQGLPGVQFLLDGNGFVGSRDDLADSDIVFLSRPDFRPGTRIRAIRILGEM